MAMGERVVTAVAIMLAMFCEVLDVVLKMIVDKIGPRPGR
jgi:hypothetical protein